MPPGTKRNQFWGQKIPTLLARHSSDNTLSPVFPLAKRLPYPVASALLDCFILITAFARGNHPFLSIFFMGIFSPEYPWICIVSLLLFLPFSSSTKRCFLTCNLAASELSSCCSLTSKQRKEANPSGKRHITRTFASAVSCVCCGLISGVSTAGSKREPCSSPNGASGYTSSPCTWHTNTHGKP